MSTLQHIEPLVKNEDILLRTITNETKKVTGFNFFNALTISLQIYYGCKYVLIGKHDHETDIVTTCSVAVNNKIVDNISYSLESTPCAGVVDQKTCYYPNDVDKLFPQDQLLLDMGVKSYLGIPVFCENISEGILIIMNDKNLDINKNEQKVIELFADRTGAEFSRIYQDGKKDQLNLINESILETLEEILYFYNRASGIISWNGDVNKLIGYNQKQLAEGGRPFYIEQIEAIDREKYLKHAKKDTINEVTEIDYRIKKGDGEVVWLSEKLSKQLNEKGEIIDIGLLSDVTIKKSEEEIRLLSIIKAIENERSRIAMELHDGLSQLIVSSKLFLSSACDTLENKHKLEQVFNLLDEAAEECTSISTNLMPKSLGRIGLTDSITELLKKYDKKFFDINFMKNIEDERFDENIEINLYRIMQETMTNVVKYAKATEVTISLQKTNSLIKLTVMDNGQGFDINNTQIKEGHGNGHLNIQSRVEALRGEFEINSTLGQGTSIFVSVPLEKN
jgi:PAS domain S-box-containing protein